MTRQRIAVVGSGVAGLMCADRLGRHHDVQLFEADGRLGGHANTYEVDDPDVGPLGVDTGFIVHNDRNYPNLVPWFEDLGVPVQDTEMSFAVTDRAPESATHGLTYRATSPNTLFADRRNIVKPTLWRMLYDIVRFYRAANRFLDDPDPDVTLAEFLDRHGFSSEFVDLHLIPMGSAVWSADPSTFADYPAQALFGFFRNHGLLGVGDRPQWRSIPGGSRMYVDAVARRFPGTIHLSSPVRKVGRSDEGVTVTTDHGTTTFDRVILAVHSDQALAMLEQPTDAEREVLGAVKYQPNRATLHYDTDLMPPFRRAWAAWNYDRRGGEQDQATLTYDMNALQLLPSRRRYLVSLNSDEFIDPSKVIVQFDYAHPVFDLPAIRAQARFDEIDGVGGVHYCGAWWRHGFHEDGAWSAVRVCERIGEGG